MAHASFFFRYPYLLEQIRMITRFGPEDIVTLIIMQGLNVRALELSPSSVTMNLRCG